MQEGSRSCSAVAGAMRPAEHRSLHVSLLYPLLILLSLASVSSWPVLGKHVACLSPSLLPPGALGTQAIIQRAVVSTLDSSQHPEGMLSLFYYPP